MQVFPKNLLIVRTDRIGDVVLSLPLVAIIKKHYPDCKITFLLKEYTRQLAENHPYIDEVLLLKEEDKKIPLMGNISQIKKRNFDTCIIVYPTLIIALIIFLSRVKIRIGTGYRWYSALFNKKVYVHRKYGEKHELEFNIDLLKEIGINEAVTKSTVKFDLKADIHTKIEIEKILEKNNILKNKPKIIVHPGSGGSAVDWPVSRFKELVQLIDEKSDAQVILTGSKNEIELCNTLCVSERIKNFVGKFNLKELIALIDLSDIFVANSTGPIHIAAALGKYTIGFYPHILACSSRRWGPYSEKSYIFSPHSKPVLQSGLIDDNKAIIPKIEDIECPDCRREQCERIGCMNTISVTDVFVRIEKICKLLVTNGENNA